MLAWLSLLVPAAIGFALGSLVPTRRPVLLLVPAVGIGVVYWILAGWNGGDPEIGREGLIIITGLIAAGFIALWAVGAVLGRYIRALWRAGAIRS